MSNQTNAGTLVLKLDTITLGIGCPANLVGPIQDGASFSVPFDTSAIPTSITLTNAAQENFTASQAVTLLPNQATTEVVWIYTGTLGATVFGQSQTITKVVLVGSGDKPAGWSCGISFGSGCVIATGNAGDEVLSHFGDASSTEVR
jgi:hypothetical protein